MGGTVYKFVLSPLREDIDEAMSEADAAAHLAEDAKDKVDSMEQLLTGSDSDADDGVLVRLQNTLEEQERDIDQIKQELQRSNRLRTEETYNIQQIVRALDQVDAVEVEENDAGGYTFRTRGGSETDGGVPFGRRDESTD